MSILMKDQLYLVTNILNYWPSGAGDSIAKIFLNILLLHEILSVGSHGNALCQIPSHKLFPCLNLYVGKAICVYKNCEKYFLI